MCLLGTHELDTNWPHLCCIRFLWLGIPGIPARYEVIMKQIRGEFEEE